MTLRTRINTWMLVTLCLCLTPYAWAQDSAPTPNPRVQLKTTLGDITVELNAQKAPRTVENFLQYVKDGAYDNTIFHRVIQKFMIQGGGFTPDMHQKKTRPPIENEATNGLANRLGTIAMARTPDPHSATNQFFINTKDNLFLNHKDKTGRGWGYCVFGQVVAGMDVVKTIEAQPTGIKHGYRDVPLTPIIIQKAIVLEEKKISPKSKAE